MFVKRFKSPEWQDYRVLRLEALSLHEDVYGGSYKDEATWEDSRWAALFADHKNAFFGLYDQGELVGIACVFCDRTDKTGRSALLAGGYIRASHRGNDYSRLLYQARIDWIIHCGHFDRIVVGHKDGNEASRRANQRFGFHHTSAVETGWGDGSRGIKHSYERKVK